MKKLFLYIIIFVSIYFAFYYLGRYIIFDYLYPQKNVQTNDNTAAASYINNNINEEDKYIVTTLNDKIVVYKNSLYNLYENTEIDIEILKLTNNDIYQKLKNTIIFNDEEEMYRFLEGLSS